VGTRRTRHSYNKAPLSRLLPRTTAPIRMQLAGRRLAQTFTSADGRRVNDYTLSPDGRTLTMQVKETSPPTVSNYHVQTSLQTSFLKEDGDGSAVRIRATPMALLWKDAAGKTWLSFNEPIWITRRHSVANADPGVTKMAAALREMSRKAAQNVG